APQQLPPMKSNYRTRAPIRKKVSQKSSRKRAYSKRSTACRSSIDKSSRYARRHELHRNRRRSRHRRKQRRRPLESSAADAAGHAGGSSMKDDELEIWRRQWHSQPDVPIDLIRKVERQTVYMKLQRLALIAPVLVGVGTIVAAVIIKS